MSRAHLLTAFWYAVAIVGFAGLILFGALGDWWHHGLGALLGMGAWALLFGLVLAIVLLKMLRGGLE